MPHYEIKAVLSLDGIIIVEEDDMIIGMRFRWDTDVIPAKCLKCDGSAVSRATYPELFALWGTRFGAGDGVTTFNLPDCRGRYDMGVDGGHAINSTGGEATHVLTTAEMPAHQHNAAPEGHTGGDAFVQLADPPGTWQLTATGGQDVVSSGATDSTGGGTAHNNLPPYLASHCLVYTGH